MSTHGLSSRIKRVIWTQVLAISIATLLGVFGTALIVEDVLVRQALEGEATHYWTLFDKNKATPPPNTLNLEGHITAGDMAQIPEALRFLDLGFQRTQLADKNPTRTR